jgi:hypothetical protein
VIAKFRKTIGADVKLPPTPYQINYRGELFLYSNSKGKLTGESFEFQAKLMGHTSDLGRHRKEMEMKIGVVPLRLIEVIDGAKSWYQINDSDPAVPHRGLLEARKQREIHIEVFLGTENFDPARWQFSEVKSAKFRGTDVWEVEAKSKGTNPISLSFDKQSGLLMRLKTLATDIALVLTPGEQPRLETFERDLHFTEWKTFSGRMLPGELHAFHDGVLWQRLEPVSITFPKTMDPNLYVAPMPRNQ